MATKGVINNFVDKDYFSGTQVGVFIGNMLIDDIFNIQWQVQGGMRPVYGFKDPNFALLLRENEIVAGSFTINFKEAAYLYIILKEYQSRKAIINKSDPNLGTELQNKLIEDTLRAVRNKDNNDPVKFNAYYNRSLEETLQYDNPQTAEVDKSSAEFHIEMANALQRMRNVNDSTFENRAEALEDMIWGEASPNNISTGDPLNFKNDPPSSAPTHFRGLQETPFNITITYGDFTNNTHNHTVRVIRDIMLTGSQQVVDVSGRPIQEQYTFIARKVF